MQLDPRNSSRCTLVLARGVQDVELDSEVVGEEVDWVGGVRHDAADLGRG